MKSTLSPPVSPTPCRHGPFWVAIAALVAVLALSLLLNLTAVALFASSAPAAAGGGEDEFPRFAEIHSYGSGTAKVVRIAFTGILTRQLDAGWLGSTDPVEDLLLQIRAARQDNEVAALLLEIDSPGGDVTAADEIHRELELFRQSRDNRRLTVLVHDLAASGGYYIALPADRILAQPTSLVGSIGVILQTLNVHGLGEKIGVTDTTVKSGRNKDLLNPFRPVDPEQIRLLQDSVDAMHARFVSLVAHGRALPESDLIPLADGRLFTADDALKHRLIDGIGYWDDLLAETAALLGEDDLYVVRYQNEKSFFDRFLGAASPLPSLQSLFSAAATPRRLFLWRP